MSSSDISYFTYIPPKPKRPRSIRHESESPSPRALLEASPRSAFSHCSDNSISPLPVAPTTHPSSIATKGAFLQSASSSPGPTSSPSEVFGRPSVSSHPETHSSFDHPESPLEGERLRGKGSRHSPRSWLGRPSETKKHSPSSTSPRTSTPSTPVWASTSSARAKRDRSPDPEKSWLVLLDRSDLPKGKSAANVSPLPPPPRAQRGLGCQPRRGLSRAPSSFCGASKGPSSPESLIDTLSPLERPKGMRRGSERLRRKRNVSEDSSPKASSTPSGSSPFNSDSMHSPLHLYFSRSRPSRWRTSSESFISAFRNAKHSKTPTPEVPLPDFDISRQHTPSPSAHPAVERKHFNTPSYLASEAHKIATPPNSGRGFFFDMTLPDKYGSSPVDETSVSTPTTLTAAAAAATADNFEKAWFRVSYLDMESEEEIEADVPEHLPSSPLCPRHPKHPSGGTGICPRHGRNQRMYAF